jgi:hypothetical protein
MGQAYECGTNAQHFLMLADNPEDETTPRPPGRQTLQGLAEASVAVIRRLQAAGSKQAKFRA